MGLACALLINFQRHKVEQANNQVEMLMEYEDLLKLASNTGRSSQETLADFKSKGITSLAVYETTLEKLSAKGSRDSRLFLMMLPSTRFPVIPPHLHTILRTSK